MEIVCSICCCSLIGKQEIGLPFTSSPGSNNSNEAVSSICGHLYHKACIKSWISRSSSCPECRTTINRKEDLHKLYFNIGTKSDESVDQQEAEEERLQMQKRTETLTKYIKHITKELGHVELKFDKLKQEIARKDQEISDLKNLLNQERLTVPLRRQTLK